MSALGDARAAVGVALVGVGVPVHIYPPTAPQPPCVALFPRDDWVTPRQSEWYVSTFTNPASGNEAASARMDELVEAVRTALSAARIQYGATEIPRLDQTSGLLRADTPITVRTTCI